MTLFNKVTTECKKNWSTYTSLEKSKYEKCSRQISASMAGFSVNLIIETALAIFVMAGGMCLTSAIVVIKFWFWQWIARIAIAQQDGESTTLWGNQVWEEKNKSCHSIYSLSFIKLFLIILWWYSWYTLSITTPCADTTWLINMRQNIYGDTNINPSNSV